MIPTPLHTHFDASAYWKTHLESWGIFWVRPPLKFPPVENIKRKTKDAERAPEPLPLAPRAFLVSRLWVFSEPKQPLWLWSCFLYAKSFLCLTVPSFNTRILKVSSTHVLKSFLHEVQKHTFLTLPGHARLGRAPSGDILLHVLRKTCNDQFKKF